MLAKNLRDACVFGVGIALFFVLCGSVSAEAIPIINGDFESSSYSWQEPPTGWAYDHPWCAAVQIVGDHGYVAQINCPGNDSNNGQGKISQVLAANYAAGTYVLTGDVRQPATGWWAAGHTFALYYGGTEVKSATWWWSIDMSTNWTEGFALTVGVAPTDACVGQPIKVVLEHAGVGDAQVDNVRLDFTPIPEPGTLALMACGLIGLFCYAWRKRK